MLQINTRYLWLLLGGSISCVLLSGIVCYYAGYYVASKEFSTCYMADSLNDRLTAALYTLYGDIEVIEVNDDLEAPTIAPEETSESERMVIEQKGDSESGAKGVSSESGEVFDVIESSEASLLYDAYLIGFGAKRSADRYAAKLAEQNINASVLARENKNSRGKKIMWYQVAIGPLPYHELLEVVELLKYRDKLEGVVFMEHKS